jgi:VIT1/CCC1 family predicted Fe2+/Mn2+ transporter
MSKDSSKQYLINRDDELNSALLYETLAGIEANPKMAELYQRLAETERSHAQAWEARLEQAGVPVPAFRPTRRTRLLIWLSRRMGPSVILPAMTVNEIRGRNSYADQAGGTEMAAQEGSHARLLTMVSQTTRGGLEGTALAQLEGRHRTAGGNALRAAVLGANDGLVSNFSLVMGVAGAALSNNAILLTGIAGLLAGAISMALGEWISVQSSRELYEKQIRTEQEEIIQSPKEESEELALIYQARGLDENSARQMANQIMSNPDTALQALVRDELGIDPQELGGSAWEAAITSFVLFAVGAIIPVIPYIFLSGIPAVLISAILSALGLFLIGAAITLFTGRSIWYSGTRQMLFGLTAAAVTYLIGRLIGVNLGG